MAGSENRGALSRDPEWLRLLEDSQRLKNWKRWGPYLSERQWGTVREDYSSDGNVWNYFSHDQARSRAYRWGEDGLLGISDRECRLCFALALWNGKDPILKERLFGLTGPEGNHGEDVKELYYYLDSTPTHTYMKALYKYTQAEYPYADLVQKNRERSKSELEYELEDTSAISAGMWDVQAEYAKEDDNDIAILVTITNRGPEEATVHAIPTLWFRNTWIWGCLHEGCTMKPNIRENTPPDAHYSSAVTQHETLEPMDFYAAPLETSTGDVGPRPPLWFTENETNTERLFGAEQYTPYTKDAFHRHLVNGQADAINPKARGTKCGAYYTATLAPGASAIIRLRLRSTKSTPIEPAMAVHAQAIDAIIAKRRLEADMFYAAHIAPNLTPDESLVQRQAFAGLLWSKQFFHIVVKDWLAGDPSMPAPPRERLTGRNRDWKHMFCRDVLSMPDKWEYPWFAAWDLAFHMIPLCRIDPVFAKDQLLLLLREWYMHANGQIPAYEFAFDDVNPPVHAWAVWRVYKISAPKGSRDRLFLERCFHKLMLNFTWWVNRKDAEGRNIFGGGFLGLDNIGVFDRSKPLPTGGSLEQADGTSWMAFYCVTMLDMALELARDDPSYEDIASKFFEHFVQITDAMNDADDGRGLWDDEDGLYFDRIRFPNCESVFLKVMSLVTVIPLFACLALDEEKFGSLPQFKKRLQWFMENRKDLSKSVSFFVDINGKAVDPKSLSAKCSAKAANKKRYLLAIPSRERLEKVLRRVLDEEQFLSPFGVRSLSRLHEKAPFVFQRDGETHTVDYNPGESRSGIFGGNSNWRGPIWLPCNWLLIEALERYHYFYGDSFRVECPTGSGRMMDLSQVAEELSSRLTRLFLPNGLGLRPCFGPTAPLYQQDAWKDLLLFHEYFDPETGRGCGASHQTGWTALVARCLDHVGSRRGGARAGLERTDSTPQQASVV